MTSPSHTPPTLGQLFRRLLPLSLSDIVMALGDPLQTMTLARLPDAPVQLASLGILKAIANFLESPIIMILHTSTALSKGRASRRALAWFTLILASFLTILFLSLVFEPIYTTLMLGVFHSSPEIVMSSRLPLLILVLWPAIIAWRRYFQGQLIASGSGRAVGAASLGRLLCVVAILWEGLQLKAAGAVVGASALIGGVFCEAVMVTMLAVRTGATRPPLEENPKLPASTLEVFRFYAPLAYTMLITWGARAVLVALVARNSPATAVAAWSAGWGFVLLVANATRMVQQLAITYVHEVPALVILQLAGIAGSLCALLLGGIAGTQAGQSLLTTMLGTDPSLTQLLLPVLQVGTVFPILVAFQNCLQGFCIARRRNWMVNLATLSGCIVTLVGTSGLLAGGWAGASAAALSMVTGVGVEVMVLAYACQPSQLFQSPASP